MSVITAFSLSVSVTMNIKTTCRSTNIKYYLLGAHGSLESVFGGTHTETFEMLIAYCEAEFLFRPVEMDASIFLFSYTIFI